MSVSVRMTVLQMGTRTTQSNLCGFGRMASCSARSFLTGIDLTFKTLNPNLNGIHPIDGKRCAQTVADLFAKAKDPDKIVVGLIEQNYEVNDPTCLETYCQEAGGVVIYRRETIRADTTKIIAKDAERSRCPRIDQIRKLAVHNVAAKGPSWARSLGRKILGNEEYCMQIDAHMKFAPEWDAKVRQEWLGTANEFGIISAQPPPLGEADMTDQIVPRNCAVEFLEVGIPVSSGSSF